MASQRARESGKAVGLGLGLKISGRGNGFKERARAVVRFRDDGTVEVRQTFRASRIGTIAGSIVTEGLIRRNAKARLVRDGVQIYEGRVGSLRRFKDDAREVQKDFECGIGIDGYNDIKIGDVIEAFELEEHAAEL